ncbi:MAG: DUF2141 domain-containing protein [Bacteroidetes bacterium]|nr:DUF2141 domain-containing protein [Bacteroidota bacterium]
MKANIIILFCLGLLILSGFSHEDRGSLTVTISNIKKTGKMHIGLYSKGDKFPDKKYQVKGLISECSGAQCTVTFDAVPYGEYAIAIFQDVNDNNELDTGFFGIPSEPVAFSNNFRPKFGGPKFDECRFRMENPSQVEKIELINSLFGGS